MGEEQELADIALLVERSAGDAMHSLQSGNARELVRLLRHDHIAEIQFWLQRALQQALRTCPARDSAVDCKEQEQQCEQQWILGPFW